MALGATFESRSIPLHSGPWILGSPLDLTNSSLLYDSEVEGRAAFRDTETSHSTGTEHFSGSLGLAVGCPFLSGNVTGTYGKTVVENRTVGPIQNFFPSSALWVLIRTIRAVKSNLAHQFLSRRLRALY